jgi:hypothetical protein
MVLDKSKRGSKNSLPVHSTLVYCYPCGTASLRSSSIAQAAGCFYTPCPAAKTVRTNTLSADAELHAHPAPAITSHPQVRQLRWQKIDRSPCVSLSPVRNLPRRPSCSAELTPTYNVLTCQHRRALHMVANTQHILGYVIYSKILIACQKLPCLGGCRRLAATRYHPHCNNSILTAATC